jgi:tRNA/tmRNA/rRNA uracil-C5-methylase (TrmA/RlmC/RlmD family)
MTDNLSQTDRAAVSQSVKHAKLVEASRKSDKSYDPDNPNFDSRAWIAGGCKTRRLGVFGSRTLKDERVEILILEKMRAGRFDMLVTCQEPQGVSEVAQRVGKKYGYPLELHFLNMRYLRGAFEQRSKEIVKICDEFLIVHDGKSVGTANEKLLVEKSGKPFQYEQLAPTPFDRSVGFNVDREWGSGEVIDLAQLAKDIDA